MQFARRLVQPPVQRRLVDADRPAYVPVGEAVRLELGHLVDELLGELRSHGGASLRNGPFYRPHCRDASQNLLSV